VKTSIVIGAQQKLRAGIRLIALIGFERALRAAFRFTGRWRPLPSQPNSILVLELADIGDLVWASAFLRELRSAYPAAEITLVVQPSVLNLVEKCPYVDRILTFHYRFIPQSRFARAGSVRWWLRALKFAAAQLWPLKLDLAVSTRADSDGGYAIGAILAYASGAPRRVGYRAPDDHANIVRRHIRGLFTDGPTWQRTRHEVDAKLDVLRSLGTEPTRSDPELWISDEDRAAAQRLCPSTTDMLVALAPGAGWEFRKWPVTSFAELGRWLQDEFGAHVLLLGSPADENACASIASRLHPGGVTNLAGLATLRQMGALLERCQLFVGNDSGPLHAAAAAGVRSVGLYGPGMHERFGPWGDGHEMIRLGLPCSPCYGGCIFESARCMEGISFAAVERAIHRLTATARVHC
jgi:heptosyltransferase-2